MAQSANITNCPLNLDNCPFATKAVCITAFIAPKSIIDCGMLDESTRKENAELKICVGAYHSDGSICYTLHFTDPLKALRYAYVLKEREECPISKYSMELLKSAVKAQKANAEKSEPQPEPAEEKAVEKPKRKSKKVSSMKKAG